MQQRMKLDTLSTNIEREKNMKTFEEFLTESIEVTFFKKYPKAFLKRGSGDSLWFRFSESESRNIINIMKKVNSPLSLGIAKDAENEEEFSETIPVQVGDKFYGLYFSHGIASMSAGGGFDKPNIYHTKFEIQDAIKSGKYSIV